ncbi:MAG: tetratricopeptide repeat protein [Candidatus Omnitrophica bacterium]|nr:tetratricopeptide repeat protein [Candidatus Omnitrophota bacterium]
MRQKKTYLKYLVIIFLVAAGLYANTLKNEFVSDDLAGIVNNPSISKVFLAPDPVAFSYSLNYLIAKLDPAAYHLFNIILHALNSILVFFLLSLFFKERACLLGALLFAAHPVHTEAVTWISGRPYLMFTFFLLASFLFYTRATTGERINVAKSAASLTAYLFALYCSVFSFAFVFIPVFYDITFSKGRRGRRLWWMFFVLALWRLFTLGSGIRERVDLVNLSNKGASLANPVYNTAYSFFSHLKLLFWPADLTLYHEPNIVSFWVLAAEVFILSVLLLSLPYLFKKAKELFFALLIFIMFLSPTYSPVGISWLVAERYLYFPSLALSILAAFFIEKYSGRKLISRAINLILISVILLYSYLTVLRNADWKTHESIWRATVKSSPLSPKAHNNMGDVYSREGNLEGAAREFTRAIELKGDYADAYHNLGHTYQIAGKLDQAIYNYKKAVSFNPRLYQSYRNLAVIYLKRGQPARVKENLEKALSLIPGDAGLRRALEELGRD